MSAIEILAVIGIIGYIIFRQVQGEPLRGKRVVLLPAILTVIGFLNLRSGGTHLTTADVACLVVGIAGSAAIGLAFGANLRLRERGGYLWGQLPLYGLWLWAALIGWRVVIMLAATGLHAHLAASSATLLLSLGANRLAQAAVVVIRAKAMGVPFAPEKDGRVFMAGAFNRGFGPGTGLGDRFNGGSFDYDGQRPWDARNGYNGQNIQDGYSGYGTDDRYGTDNRYRRTHPASWDRP